MKKILVFLFLLLTATNISNAALTNYIVNISGVCLGDSLTNTIYCSTNVGSAYGIKYGNFLVKTNTSFTAQASYSVIHEEPNTNYLLAGCYVSHLISHSNVWYEGRAEDFYKITLDVKEPLGITWYWITVNAYYLTVSNINSTTWPLSGWMQQKSTNHIQSFPNIGYSFVGWGGDVDPAHSNDNPLVFIMNTNKTIINNVRPYQISGTINYTGIQTGLIHIVAVTNRDQWISTNFNCEKIITYSPQTTFVMTNVPAGSYWVKAWIDSNKNGTKSYLEPSGTYFTTNCSEINDPDLRILTNADTYGYNGLDATNNDIILTDLTDDSDNDGLPDYWEIYYFETRSCTAYQDYDGDSLNNLQEYQNGTNPTKKDTDNDGLNDWDELNIFLTNPLKYDTDNDGMSDGDEVFAGFNPTDPLSVFKILNQTINNNELNLTFSCKTLCVYHLQSLTNILENNWTNILTINTLYSETYTVNITTEAPETRFYRVISDSY
jgi:hypothetical protein